MIGRFMAGTCTAHSGGPWMLRYVKYRFVCTYIVVYGAAQRENRVPTTVVPSIFLCGTQFRFSLGRMTLPAL